MIVLIILGIFAMTIAYLIGRKRQIGFGWSFFFCFFLTPIGGFIITMSSRQKLEPNPKPSKSKKIWGWILSIFGFFALIGQIIAFGSGRASYAFLTAIGLIGLGSYLIELGKGKNFNTKTQTEKQ